MINQGELDMIKILPTFKGYTVDLRLKEFRKAESDQRLEFIPFDSVEGELLLEDYVSNFDSFSEEKQRAIINLW